MIEYRPVMWDVVSNDETVGYIELGLGGLSATSSMNGGSTADMFTDAPSAAAWLIEQAKDGSKGFVPRRAGDRKGDIA